MLVNLFICWLWLTFIGMRLFGPGRKIMSSEKVGYTNYALEEESNGNKIFTNYSTSENITDISLQERKPDEEQKKISKDSLKGI